MTDIPFLFTALSLVANAIVLRVVGFVTNGLTFESWGAALGAAVIAYVVGLGVTYLAPFMLPASSELSPITHLVVFGLLFVTANLVSLALAGTIISGVQINGAGGLVIAAVVLTIVEIGMATLPALMNTA